jgi:hypothetical protein
MKHEDAENRRPKTPKPQSHARSRMRGRTGCDLLNLQEDIARTATTITMLTDGSKHTNNESTTKAEAEAPTTTTLTGARRRKGNKIPGSTTISQFNDVTTAARRI